jgi:acetyl coenzyme A synthetase (ADP forming)-like protein
MKKFFEPKSVAIVGASRDETKPGRVILEGMKENFRGKIYPVNNKVNPKDQSTQEIGGLKAYQNLIDIPGEVDLVVISVPAKFVADTLRQCKKKNVGAVVVISGGFKEIGRNDLEDELKEIVKKSKFKLIGPNCLGVTDFHTGVNTSFIAGERIADPEAGTITLMSQSGAVASTTVDWAADRGIGLAKMISYGNAADLDEADFLEFLRDDPKTKVIMLYDEGISDGRKFMEAAKKTALKKPIVAVKAGKGESGAKAVASHTGSLAGSIKVFSAAMKQCGVIEVNSLEELLDFGKALNFQPIPKGKRVAIVTCGGGFGVMATDAVEIEGLEMAELSEKSVKMMKSKFPDYVITHNPIDLIGDADAKRYKVSMEAVCTDPNVDAVLLILLFQIPKLESIVVDQMIEMQKYGKPIIGVSAGSDFTKKHVVKLEKGGIPFYTTPERGIRAIKALVKYRGVLEKLKNE